MYVCFCLYESHAAFFTQVPRCWRWCRNAGEPAAPKGFELRNANESDVLSRSSHIWGSSHSAEIICCLGKVSQRGLWFLFKLGPSWAVVHRKTKLLENVVLCRRGSAVSWLQPCFLTSGVCVIANTTQILKPFTFRCMQSPVLTFEEVLQNVSPLCYLAFLSCGSSNLSCADV